MTVPGKLPPFFSIRIFQRHAEGTKENPFAFMRRGFPETYINNLLEG